MPASHAPSWYQVTGDQQGPNVVDRQRVQRYPSGPTAATCSPTAAPSTTCRRGPTRRGDDPQPEDRHPQQQRQSAPGGRYALINYFHAYIINPSKPGETVNLPAAQDFVNFLTSPAFQSQLKTYLADDGDPGGPPFVADASPNLTAPGFPSDVHRRQAADGDRNADQRRAGLSGARRPDRHRRRDRRRPAGRRSRAARPTRPAPTASRSRRPRAAPTRSRRVRSRRSRTPR